MQNFLKVFGQLLYCLTYEDIATELDPVFNLKTFQGTQTAAQMYLLMVQKDDFVTRKEDVQRAAKIMTKLIDNSASEVRELAFQVLGKMQDKFLSFIEKLLSDLNFTKRQKVN